MSLISKPHYGRILFECKNQQQKCERKAKNKREKAKGFELERIIFIANASAKTK